MKNKYALTLLLIANSVSGFAQGISMLAIPWYFTEILQRPSLFGTIYAITTLVSMAWTVMAGTVIDRYPRKNVFLTLNAIGLTILGSISLFGISNGGLPAYLVATVFVFTILNFQLHYPTLYAFGQEITEVRNYGKVNSLLETLGQSTAILAGGMAALLLSGFQKEINWLSNLPVSIDIAPWPIEHIFLMDAATYLLALVIISFIRYQPTEDLRIDRSSFIDRLQTGFTFLRSNKRLFLFGVATHSVFVIALVNIHLLQPVYVKSVLNDPASSFALSKVFYSCGALISGIFIRRVFRNISTVQGIMVLMGIATLAFSTLFINTLLGIFVMVSFFVGISNAGTRILRVTYLFEHIPNNIIGRANSIFQMINILLRFCFIYFFSLAFFVEEGRVDLAYLIGGFFIFISLLPIVLFYQKLVTLRVKPLKP